jgi:hypothetical protein
VSCPEISIQIKKERIEMKEEKDKIKQLEKELQAAKKALEKKTMVVDALEILIEKANRHYETDLKKNFGQEQ